MMKYLIFVFAVIFTTNGFTQDVNKIVVDEKLNKEVLIGPCDRKGLESDVFAEYYHNEYKAYNMDASIVKRIKDLKKGVEVIIVMASWCHDSKVQVPRFYKIMDEAGVRESKLTLIAVDRAKTAGDTDISWLNIERVPTFILYKKDREIGRIIESPNSTLEKDILLILSMASN